MKKLILFLCVIASVLSAEMPNEVSVETLKGRVLTGIRLLEGWCSDEKALHFIDMIIEEQPDVWVEIGAFGGASVFPAASAMKFVGHGSLFAIDPWDKLECIKYFDPVAHETDLKWWGSMNMDYIHFHYLNMLMKYQLDPYVTNIRKTSENAAPFITDEIDVLHIDGNHSEYCSIQDVKLYLPKVRQGGYVWYNDCMWSDRQEALDLLLEECEVVKLIDGGNCMLLKKL